MSVKIILFLLAMSCVMTGCSDAPRSPSDTFLIPDSQLPSVTRDAEHGDLVAIKRLIAHHEASTGNDTIAEEWRVKARALGDAQELYYYAARTFTAARNEPDLAKRREMLISALESAERSYRSSADTSTQQLVDDINKAIVSLPPFSSRGERSW